jgi:uncharacterized protein
MKQNPVKKKFSLRKFLKRTAAVLISIYLGVCGLLFFFQESLMFHPKPFSKSRADSIMQNVDRRFTEELNFTMADGKKITGWFVKDSTEGKKPLVIYYPGNAEEVSYLMEKKDKLPGCNMALLNYRGYGTSEGEPSEEKFFSDALETFDQLLKRADVDAENVFAFGRSIGTGVATYVAKNRNVRGTILTTPYDCMKDLSQEKYPYVPVSLLLRHGFNSIDGAEKISTPVLCYIASEDEIIPPWHAYNLMLKWKGDKTIRIFEGASHNNITKRDGYWDEIFSFIEAHKPGIALTQ